MRVIDADALEKAIDNTTMSQEQRVMFHALIAQQPRTGYSNDEVDKIFDEINYWRDHCSLLENTIIKLAVKFMQREKL